ncbi:MAG: 4Fe-4S cluster-binding domain-containing protein [Firmicutes bacterium]|nr:4Fe-4S cluster-binding domain-containing protein [Bacillota bacterium]
MHKSYKDLFNGNLRLTMGRGAAVLSDYPRSKRALIRVVKNLKASDKKRAALNKGGLEVPPLIIVSATYECNLNCKGCYSCGPGRDTRERLFDARKAEILDEASALGVSTVMLAGGEPLLSKGWLESLAAHPELLGIVFTNGTLLDRVQIEWFAANRHILPVVSIEGGEEHTDARRGAGIYAAAQKSMAALCTAGVSFGISVTATSENIGAVCAEGFAEEYIDKGCRLFFYVEYVPVEKGTEPLVLSAADKKKLQTSCRANGRKYAALFVPFPGDEEQYGGCLAAGRGFLHISAEGALEPCPFAPFSDTNLATVSLRDALSSPMLARVRENSGLLKEGASGCALWNDTDLFLK